MDDLFYIATYKHKFSTNYRVYKSFIYLFNLNQNYYCNTIIICLQTFIKNCFIFRMKMKLFFTE